MNFDAWNGKTNAQKFDYEQCGTASNVGLCDASSRPLTLREQAENNVGYHRSEAAKADRAAAFFRDNPAFDEFIQLVRSGAIQF